MWFLATLLDSLSCDFGLACLPAERAAWWPCRPGSLYGWLRATSARADTFTQLLDNVALLLLRGTGLLYVPHGPCVTEDTWALSRLRWYLAFVSYHFYSATIVWRASMTPSPGSSGDYPSGFPGSWRDLVCAACSQYRWLEVAFLLARPFFHPSW